MEELKAYSDGNSAVNEAENAPLNHEDFVNLSKKQIEQLTQHRKWISDLFFYIRNQIKDCESEIAEFEKTKDRYAATDDLQEEYQTRHLDLETKLKTLRKKGNRIWILLESEKKMQAESEQVCERLIVQKSMGQIILPEEAARPEESRPSAVSRIASRIRRYLPALLVFAPAVLTLLYCLLVSSPMYISQSSFAIRTSESASVAGNDLASVFLKTPSTNNDIYILEDYIRSLDLAQSVDGQLGIISHYADRQRDVISRLWKDCTQDELLDYWRWIVKPELNVDTGIITLSVRAYTPEMARSLAQAVLSSSEALVNTMNERAQQDAVLLAEREISRAEDRVRRAQEELRAFRDSHTMLDPKVTAAGLQGLVTQLEGEATTLRTQISEAQSYMQSNAPALRQLRQRLAAVEKQLAEEKHRVAGQDQSQSNLSSIVADYESLMLEADFAQKQFVSAMTSLEQARVQQASQSRYVVAYQKPTLPDESLFPKPFIFALYVLLATVLLLGIFSLIWASIREHAGF